MMRFDNEIIGHWIKPESRVLDLGCGDGSLLKNLSDSKSIRGYGLEIDPDGIQSCVEKGLNIIEKNLDEGLSDFDDDSFDMVIMSQALQTMHYPQKILSEMVRIGRECIVTIPNFGHWRTRFHLMFMGRMPISERLPYEWYNTPNIHFCTFKDFNILCEEMSLKVIDRLVVSGRAEASFLNKVNPNLFGETGIFRLSK